jgi:hypothetical protein
MARTINLSFNGGSRMNRVLSLMERRVNNARAVNVGFLASATYPSHYSHRVEHRISPKRGTKYVAQAAFWNEFGTVRSPERPYFRTMIAEKSPRWGDSMAYLARAHNYDARAMLTSMGHGIQGQLVDSIRGWQDPPNAPLTVEIKGFNKPLVDEGIMQNSVSFEVVDR